MRPLHSIGSPLLALVLGLGLSTSSPAVSEAAVVGAPAPAKLAPLPKPELATTKTKAGTPIAIWMWPGSEWTGSPDWFPSPKVSLDKAKPATGEIVLVMFDCGDGVSVEPYVQMLRAMGATVVAFNSPQVGFDIPLAGFDNPLAGGKKVEGDMGVASKAGVVGATPEPAVAIVNAMITWAATKASADGQHHRVHLFGVGRGADLALEVGTKRSADVRSILVDDPTFHEESTSALPIGDTENNLPVRVLRATSPERGKLGKLPAGVTLAAGATSYPKTATPTDLAQSGSYHRAVAELIAFPDNEDW